MKTALLTLAFGMIAATSMAAEGGVPDPQPFKLTTIYGDSYANCRVLKVTPETVTIMHEQGVTKIGLELLGPELQRKFQYDPAKAKAFAKAEQVRKERAEARAAELKEERDQAEEARMAKLMEEEKRLLRVAAEREKAIAEAHSTVPMPDTARPLGPMPGDATPNLGSALPAPVVIVTEELVPVHPPITQVYSPGQSQGSRYYSRSVGYTVPWYNGYGYGYGGYDYGYSGYGYRYGSGYRNPQYCYPARPSLGNPPYFQSPRPAPISGTIRVGNGVLRINR